MTTFRTNRQAALDSAVTLAGPATAVEEVTAGQVLMFAEIFEKWLNGKSVKELEDEEND